MRILVTGGAGFLGYHLVSRLLAVGHEVTIFDDFSTGTMRNVEILERRHAAPPVLHRADVRAPWTGLRRFEQIYHLACPASPLHYQWDPIHTIETAILGTQHALEAAHRWGARLVLASTSEIYGSPTEHPQTERYWGHVNSFGARSCYDEGKRAGEALAWAYAQQGSVDVRIARIFNSYGPRMRFDDGRVISNFLLQALRGQPITIYGDGTQTRSFCYATDTIDGLVRLMARAPLATEEGGLPANHPVNLGNPEEFTLNALVDEVARAVRGEGDLTIVRSPLPVDDPPRRCPDITRAMKLLDWSPKISLAEGLRFTLVDFRGRLVVQDARAAK